ncbi:MAG: glycine cleavage system aminomethyltransferase T, partial [Myxococcota bacterium]
MLEFDRALAVGASGAVFGPVPDAVVGLHGPDARRFANGMFTNNVRDLAVGQWGRSFGLDDRGRIIMQIDVLCVGEQGFEVIVEGGADGFVERYET